MGERALVVGFGLTGEAVTRRLRERGTDVVATEDAPRDAAAARAAALGAELVAAPAASDAPALVARADVVVPSPGVPLHHPVLQAALARGVPVRSEVEVAAGWARCPLVAVTGTNGKSTVTSLATRMLVASGVRAEAAGNIGVPLVDAVHGDADVLVVEVSSFQLRFTEAFRPRVAVWLNVGEDHLDWHGSMADYVAAKGRVWARQGEGDLAVANADDATVMAEARRLAGPRLTTFAARAGAADWHVAGGALRMPGGAELCPVARLPRAFPHDLGNALAAAAAALEVGATVDGARQALESFEGLPHRVEYVGELGGARWYDDSKATDPHAVLAAVANFGSVVLLAGGRNKGNDLGALRQARGRLRAVVAIGEAAPEVARAFEGICPVAAASSMDQAVAEAASLARPGDTVLLSPGGSSFDWYGSYAERGDDFRRAFEALAATGRPASPATGPRPAGAPTGGADADHP